MICNTQQRMAHRGAHRRKRTNDPGLVVDLNRDWKSLFDHNGEQSTDDPSTDSFLYVWQVVVGLALHYNFRRGFHGYFRIILNQCPLVCTACPGITRWVNNDPQELTMPIFERPKNLNVSSVEPYQQPLNHPSTLFDMTNQRVKLQDLAELVRGTRAAAHYNKQASQSPR